MIQIHMFFMITKKEEEKYFKSLKDKLDDNEFHRFQYQRIKHKNIFKKSRGIKRKEEISLWYI